MDRNANRLYCEGTLIQPPLPGSCLLPHHSSCVARWPGAQRLTRHNHHPPFLSGTSMTDVFFGLTISNSLRPLNMAKMAAGVLRSEARSL